MLRDGAHGFLSEVEESQQDSSHSEITAESMLLDFEHQLDTLQSLEKRSVLLNHYAYVHYMQGAYEKAKVLTDSAFRLATRLNHPRGLEACHDTYIAIYKESGDYHRALHHSREYIDIIKSLALPDSVEIAIAYNVHANLLTTQKAYYHGLDTLQLAYELLPRHGYQRNLAFCLGDFATIYFALGEDSEGRSYQERAIAELKAAGGGRNLPNLLCNQATWLMEDGRYAEAEQNIDEAEAYSISHGYELLLAKVHLKRGQLEAHRGKHRKAVSLFENGYTDFAALQDTVDMLGALLGMAVSLDKLDEPDRALQTCEKIEIMLASNTTESFKAEFYSLRSQLFEGSGDLSTAIHQKKLHLKSKQAADSIADFVQARNLEARFRNGQQKIAILEKDKALTLQAAEIDQKNSRLRLLGAGALVLSLLALLVLLRYRQRLKLQKQETELELNQALIESTEEERERIARELHDGTGSLLTGIKLRLEHLQENMVEPDQAQQLGTTICQVQTVAKEVRRVSHAMAPTAIERLPFEEVVTDLINAFSHIGKAEIDYSSSGDFEQMNKTERLMLYRILQECLNNSFKHADASEITISLLATETEIEMLYQDNGKGYDPAMTGNGLGLSSIEKRIHYLHGKQTIETETGSGMMLILNFPILRV